MPAPDLLTLCKPAQIDWSRPETPTAKGFDDIYFSVDGGLDEARTVFLEACGLPERWLNHDYFAIGELGFGTGLNFLATWDLWNKASNPKGRLHFISIEKFPLDQAQLKQALKAWPNLSHLAEQLIEKWPGRVKGYHQLHFGNVSLTLIHDDIGNALEELSGKFDAWFLDGFSPSKNPDMWSLKTMQTIADLTNSGARLGTFTVARAVREALTEAGFAIVKKEGFGRKRDRLEAIFSGANRSQHTQAIQPVIIGAGIAGSALAYSFQRRGISPIIIDPGDDTAASANPTAIVKPRLDIQDRPESRFFLASYLYALQYYQETESVLESGVTHICLEEKDIARHRKLLTQMPLPDAHFKLEEGPNQFSITFPKAVTVDPSTARKHGLQGTKIIKGRAASVQIRGDLTEVLDENGQVLARGTHVIWTCGFGIRPLKQFDHLSLRYSRGQISEINQKIEHTTTYGGYAVPLGKTTLIGATHKRLDETSPFEPRADDDRENAAKYFKAFGTTPETLAGKSRSSVRVTTPSTMPLIFGGDQEWGITGLGSRGFVYAPLLAESLAAKICREVLPMSEKAWARFRAREKFQPGSAP